ncbi:MAG TPA: glycosyl transferase family 2 [Deltaproteobacteria bacterium]|nr:glycosyl transferase family 2 [Deltaproteobacteria bacterium]
MEIDRIGEADVVVGIPSYNNARTIGHVVRAVQAGLAKYFPRLKAVLVNSDGGSTDGTTGVVHGTVIDDFRSIMVFHDANPLSKIAALYSGIPGKGSAFRAVFEIASALGAKACAVVDSDLRSITPEWMELLLKPVLNDGFDYVSPLYHRHKYDGTITNNIVYPITRALYGKQIRQPIGGDFGFSGELSRFYLTKDVWESDVARFGIDIWMTTTALANQFKVCQAFLGAKIHDAKDPGTDLSDMLAQVLSATFDLMEEYSSVWQGVTGSERVPTFGFNYAVGLEPVPVDVRRMVERFRLGVRELSDIWKLFLPLKILGFLEEAAMLPERELRFPDPLWAEIIFGFATASHRRLLHKEHLLKSITPLYIGRVASFILDNTESDGVEVEGKIESLCMSFEDRKHFLLENWE